MLENTVLLIGLGTNKYKLDEIIKVESKQQIEEKYGVDSCFFKAYSVTTDFNKNNHEVYILNIDSWEHIKKHKEILEELNFEYIVPLDLYIDDNYYDRYYQKYLTYSQLILLTIHRTISTIIMTGSYAQEYETLDDFLEKETDRIDKVRFRFENLRKEGLIYVANIISGNRYANMILALILCNTDYGNYPKMEEKTRLIFEIDYSDMENNNIVYFKNNYLTGITIENLLNFSGNKTTRLVPVHKIIKYFYFHKANFDQFIGQSYTEYRKLKIREELMKFLDSLVGWIIYKYKITSMNVTSSEYGSVDIQITYDIWPKFTTEKYTIETSI